MHAVFLYPDSVRLGDTTCRLRFVTKWSKRKDLSKILQLRDVVVVRYVDRPIDCIGCLAHTEDA